jgi:hypothetical protein
MEDQHAQADEGVAEENCDGEQHHDEEDMDLLANVAVGQCDCEVWKALLAYYHEMRYDEETHKLRGRSRERSQK